MPCVSRICKYRLNSLERDEQLSVFQYKSNLINLVFEDSLRTLIDYHNGPMLMCNIFN